MADNRKRELLATMAKWSDHRGCRPFANASSGHAIDRCNEYLGNASALLSMLSAANEDAHALLNKADNSEFSNRSCTIMAGALDGIGTLIDLAAFMLESE